MDILTLGKMNQMAKNTDQALELMANHVYEAQSDIWQFQATNETAIDSAVTTGLANIQGLIDTGVSSEPQKHFFIYNTSHWTVTNGGCCLQWTVPAGTQIITFEILQSFMNSIIMFF